MRAIAIALGLAVLAAGFTTVPAQARDEAVSLSAAAKKHHVRKHRAKRYVVRRAWPAQSKVACTAFGCRPIPPGCTPTTGYDWWGNPTGFDDVVCR